MESLKSIGLFAGFFFLIACGNKATSNETAEKQTVLAADTQVQTAVDETNVAKTEELEVVAEATSDEISELKPEKSSPKTVKKAAEPAKDLVAKTPEVNKTESTASATTPEAQPQNEAGKPSHDQWNELLQKYVSTDGKVNYAGFKKDMPALESYLGGLTRNPVQDDWSRNEKMAYWINAYNAFTVKLIVDNYPVASITKLHNGKPWDVKWIQLGSKTYSLNNIENDILRPKFKDARIHFAVNCAAVSCPPLLNRAWTADKLNQYFEQQAKAFINNPKYNKINANSVEISKIFDWYGGDFGNIIDYLNQYSTTKINSDATVKYMEYDWDLNAK